MFDMIAAGMVHEKAMTPEEFRASLMEACNQLGIRCNARVPGTQVVMSRDPMDVGAALITITAPGQKPQKFQVKYDPLSGQTTTISVYEA